MSPKPLVIAHRGASGYRPEHTLEAYELAITMGADFIEPDLVITKDGVLLARHESELSKTTDVADHPELAHYRTTKRIEGHEVTGWFAEDLTFAEVTTLRARERHLFRSHEHDGLFKIPTFDEVLDLAVNKSRETGRPIGVYPETKHPSYFRSLGLPLEESLLAALEDKGRLAPLVPVFIQSFETANLQAMRRQTDLPLIQLLDFKGQPRDLAEAGDPRTYDDLATPQGLAAIAGYAQGIGPHKRRIVPAGPDGRLLPPTSLVADAHRAGLAVHSWTFRSEEPFLAPDYSGVPEGEYEQFFDLRVDGVFSDFASVAVHVRDAWQRRRA
jgi:glycerophosphoryl diester phosphodiesterase